MTSLRDTWLKPDKDEYTPLDAELDRLRSVDEFWQWLGICLPSNEIARRKAHYAAYFEQRALPPHVHLHLLRNDFFNDCWAQPSPAAPFKCVADLDEALAEVKSFEDWPHDRIPTGEDGFDPYEELAEMGLLDGALALERVKSNLRLRYILKYDLPLFPAPSFN